MNETYLYVIIALLPLSASMVVVQVNPYHALVIRGILGAIAALVYAVLGAADVALTEALVGTMLAITLYAVAVRSSMVMRLGVLEAAIAAKPPTEPSSLEAPLPTTDVEKQTKHQPLVDPSLTSLVADLRTFLGQHYMRLDLVPYATPHDLEQALQNKDIHAFCVGRSPVEGSHSATEHGLNDHPPYQTTVRIQRLYDLMQAELPSSLTSLVYRPAPSVDGPKSPVITVKEVQP